MVSKSFYFHPYLGKIPNLTNIFQMGWNHQLETCGFLEKFKNVLQRIQHAQYKLGPERIGSQNGVKRIPSFRVLTTVGNWGEI